jgi:hypothetical protein
MTPAAISLQTQGASRRRFDRFCQETLSPQRPDFHIHSVPALQLRCIRAGTHSLLITVLLDCAANMADLQSSWVDKVGETSRQRNGIGECKAGSPNESAGVMDLTFDINHLVGRGNSDGDAMRGQLSGRLESGERFNRRNSRCVSLRLGRLTAPTRATRQHSNRQECDDGFQCTHPLGSVFFRHHNFHQGMEFQVFGCKRLETESQTCRHHRPQPRNLMRFGPRRVRTGL